MQSIKSISGVISITIMILVSISLISIVYVSVNKMIKPEFSPAMNCLDFQLNPPVKILNACHNGSELQITLEKSSEAEIFSLEFVSSFNKENQKWRCDNACNCVILKNNRKTYYFEAEKPEQVSVLVNSCPLDSVQVSACNL